MLAYVGDLGILHTVALHFAGCRPLHSQTSAHSPCAASQKGLRVEEITDCICSQRKYLVVRPLLLLPVLHNLYYAGAFFRSGRLFLCLKDEAICNLRTRLPCSNLACLATMHARA